MCIKEIIKKIKFLEEEKNNILNVEMQNLTSTYQDKNIDYIPTDYDFKYTRTKIEELNSEVAKYKHILNVCNSTVIVPEFGETIDQCIVKMGQYNLEISLLETMSKRKERSRSTTYNGAIEYIDLNYRLDECKSYLELYKQKVQDYQMAIDRINLNYIVEVI